MKEILNIKQNIKILEKQSQIENLIKEKHETLS